MIRRVLLWITLLAVITACSSQAPQFDDAASLELIDPVTAEEIEQSLSVWRNSLVDYLKQPGESWSSRLAGLRDLRGTHVLRPERITFSALAQGNDIRDPDTWDIQGLFLGRKTLGYQHWYVFIVGVIEREDYRPVAIRDIRLMALTRSYPRGSWAQGAADAESLDRYGRAYRHQSPVHFPADDDRYQVDLVEERVRVRENGSGAEWTLDLKAMR